MSTIFPGSASVGQIFEGYSFNGAAWDIIGIDLTAEYLETSDASATYLTQTSASTNYATKLYTDNAVASLVDSAPSTLNTLNELAAALGDDANFATTITNALSPVGSVTAYALSTPPAGWLLCDGTIHNISSYPTLGAGLGSTYGGNGTTTFAVPNLKGRIPVGLDSSQTEFDTRGETGGAKTHTITTAEMPVHTHTQDSHNHEITYNNSTISGGLSGGNALGSFVNWYLGNSAFSADPGNRIKIASSTATNQNTGGGEAHNNLQPYIVMNYIIRAV
jgi:microcystin-dependent protein